jgi:Tol biopolymer transport system component
VRRITVPRRDDVAVEADFSPSGRLIAYAAGPIGRECCRDLYVRSVFKTLKRRLTSSPNTEDYSPAYGPGGRVFFMSFRRGSETTRIQSINATGGNRQTVFSGASGVSIPAYSDMTLSPSGRRIAFDGRRGEKIGIYLVNSDGTGLTTLVEWDYDENKGPRVVDLDFSEDGRSVAYIYWPETQGPTYSDVYVVNVETKATRWLTNDQNRYEDALVFAPDNRRVGVSTAHRPQNVTITVANRSRRTLNLGRAHSATFLDWTKIAGS